MSVNLDYSDASQGKKEAITNSSDDDREMMDIWRSDCTVDGAEFESAFWCIGNVCALSVGRGVGGSCRQPHASSSVMMRLFVGKLCMSVWL